MKCLQFGHRTGPRQDEVVPAVLAGDFRENPIQRDLGMVRVTMLARFDLLFCVQRRWDRRASNYCDTR